MIIRLLIITFIILDLKYLQGNKTKNKNENWNHPKILVNKIKRLIN